MTLQSPRAIDVFCCQCGRRHDIEPDQCECGCQGFRYKRPERLNEQLAAGDKE